MQLSVPDIIEQPPLHSKPEPDDFRIVLSPLSEFSTCITTTRQGGVPETSEAAPSEPPRNTDISSSVTAAPTILALDDDE